MTITRTNGAERTHRARDNADEDTRREVPRGTREGTAARHVEVMPQASHYLAFLANVPATSTSVDGLRDRAVQTKLDAVRDAFSGPYLVDGASVAARPMFRMLYRKPEAIVAVVNACGARAGVPAWPAIVGQCTPGQLVKITQALIDTGCLAAAPGDIATRIRQMQWDYGVGVDCAGYSKQAIAATAERAPAMYGPGWESFRDLDGKRAASFAKVSIADARAGDLITLDEIPPERYGHNVVVYSNAIADAAQKVLLASRGPDLAAFLASPGPHHVLEVDSSWGAGAEGNPCGGFRRDTWIYDASSKTWGSFDPRTTPSRFELSPRGPAGDAYHGTYRPR